MELSDYEIGPEIGRGGQGVVCRGMRRVDSTPVALKFFAVSSGAHAAALARKFADEARLLSALEHPNLVKVLDFGSSSDGRLWLAMEYVSGPGGSPAAISNRLAIAPPGFEEVRRIYSQLRAALAYCHSRGVVHGDVKAENVLVAEDGTVKLADFGIARVLDAGTRREAGLASSATLTGAFCTPYAIAPECREGGKPTFASDVYSCGVLLYKLVTGIWYEGSARLLEQAHVFAPLWAPLLERMLAHDPARRIASAEELPKDPVAEEMSRRRVRRVCAGMAFAGAVVLAIAVIGMVAYERGGIAAREKVREEMLAKEMARLPASRNPAYRDHPVVTRARKVFGTNDFDYVEEAVLVCTNKLVLTRPIAYGTLHLPDTNGTVKVFAPVGHLGPLVYAERVEGDLFWGLHLVPDRPNVKARVGRNLISVVEVQRQGQVWPVNGPVRSGW